MQFATSAMHHDDNNYVMQCSSLSLNHVANHVIQGVVAALVHFDLSVVAGPWQTALALEMVAVVLDMACATSPVVEEPVCKGCIFETAVEGGILASCCQKAFLLWLVDHIQGGCVIKTAVVGASTKEKKNVSCFFFYGFWTESWEVLKEFCFNGLELLSTS